MFNFNENVLKGNWKQIKGDMQRAWGSITDDEWERAQGNATSLSGLVEKKYGLAKEEVAKKFNDIVSRYNDKAADKIKEMDKKTDIDSARDSKH